MGPSPPGSARRRRTWAGTCCARRSAPSMRCSRREPWMRPRGRPPRASWRCVRVRTGSGGLATIIRPRRCGSSTSCIGGSCRISTSCSAVPCPMCSRGRLRAVPVMWRMAASCAARKVSVTQSGIDGTAQPAGLRRRARYSFFGARLNQWLGRPAAAQRLCRRALSYCDYTKAYRLLSELELPGEHYFKVLARVHQQVRPATYLEVGVSRGESLKLVGPQTLALGIDPQPRVAFALRARQQIFAQTSDEFFARPDVPALLGHQPLEMAFIDGMHHFEYALRDFINIEPLCAPGSLVFIHDCFPIDARSAARAQTTAFWSGDIWRLMVLL